jgi:hypothetical protein
MKGHWQKEVPSEGGQYWTATRDGHLAGLLVAVACSGEDCPWDGWWWSRH